MKKYMLYRAPKQVDRDLGKHELVGVEYGDSIDAVTDALIQAVNDELSGSQEYPGSEVCSYAPEVMESYRRTKRYQYHMTGVISPQNAEENVLVEFGIIETEDA